MDPRRGKATRTASKAGAAAPKAQGVKGPPTEPSEPPAALGTARPKAQKCGRVGAPGSGRKKRAPGSPERPPVRARNACAKKAPLGAEDAVEGLAVPAGKLAPPAAPGPPLPRTGSRRERGARAPLEQRTLPEPTEVSGLGLGLGPLVPASRLRKKGAAPGAWKPRTVLEKLKLRRQEISVAAEIVNRVVDHLQRRLQSCESEFQGVSRLCTGSYYERVKVSCPFDFHSQLRLPLQKHYKPGGLNKIRLFSESIDVIMEKKKRGSPAVTLLIRKPKEISVDIILALESKSSWPASTQEGMPISQWLGTKVKTNLRRQPFYLVPKHAKEGNGFQEETWRLSFSHIEKDLLKSHGHSKTCCETDGIKCCRKDCLKLMKYLLEQLKVKFRHRKELEKFCSYHVKTAFFHVCTRDPQDSQWDTRDLELCFDKCVTYFLECLKTEQLKHYFIPGFNLFSRDQIDKINKEFLSQQIEYERKNGFPVFYEF
uniref:Cyclic GMP-AMP synthase n=1 Tax=Neovison vison TaxID=452646 RepID=A0A8C7BC28_NEOVI